MSSSDFDQHGQQIFGNPQNADKIVNNFFASPPIAPPLAKIISWETPPRIKVNPFAPSVYLLKIAIGRPGNSVDIHDISCIFTEFQVKFLVDGIEVHKRTFSIAHSRKERTVTHSSIENFPITFASRQKAFSGTKVIHINICQRPVWRIEHD
jgi:hypothetical protein